MACLGGVVVNRAARSDVTYAFIVFYGALLFGRSLYLGEPLAIPLHRLESGALLLFTFFMISDPKTTPDSRAGRVLFAALVAFGAWYVQFRLFRTNGLLWSLAACSLVGAAHRSAAAGRPLRLARPTRLPRRRSHRRQLSTHSKEQCMKRQMFGVALASLVVWSAPDGAWLLRLLRRQGRHQAVQQGLAGGAGSRRRPHRDDDGQRLQGRPEGVRGRDSGADVPAARADPRRRQGAGRSPRRLLGAAPGRVLRREPVPMPRRDDRRDGRGAAPRRAGGRRRRRGAAASA